MWALNQANHLTSLDLSFLIITLPSLAPGKCSENADYGLLATLNQIASPLSNIPSAWTFFSLSWPFPALAVL